MTSKLSAWGARLVAVNPDGTFTPDFVRWLQRQLVLRVGGETALTNQELAEALAALAAGEQVFQPAVFQPAPPDVFQPGAAAGADLAEVMQEASCISLAETTFQT